MRKIHLFVVILMILTFSLKYSQEKISSQKKTAEKTMIHVVTNIDPIVIQEVSQKSSAALIRMPAKDQVIDLGSLESEDMEGLPRGMSYLPSVRALSENEYQPQVGKKIYSKNGIVFFESQKNQGAPVVYDRRRDTLHKITATLKLTSVDQEQRQKNINAGWSEFSYNEDLSIQYLQSSEENLLSHYRELKENGQHPSFEVVSAVHILK